MSILQSVKRAVLARQGGKCVGIKEDGEVCGYDLDALKRARAMHKYLPKGRTAVEFDHIEPRAGGGADDPDNIQALCGWCHHAKTELERSDWERPSPSVFAERLVSRGPRGKGGGGKGGKGRTPSDKIWSLRTKYPSQKYG